MPRRLTIVTLVPLFILSFGAAASAKKPAATPREAPPAEATTPPVESPAPPAEAESAPAEAEVAPGAEAAAEEAPATMMTPVNQPHWGGAFRARWVSLPHWFFGMFTKASQPVSSYSIGLEGYRRKRDSENPNRFWEISFGLGYQNMSAPDGNWLGSGHNAAIDTDWVQFKNFGFWTIDLTFIQRQFFNDVFGIHYGAGLGLAIIQGDILRTSSSSACTDANVGDPSKCRPIVCTSQSSGCTETELKNPPNPALPDSPSNPNRFREGSVPGAIPIINLIAGFDFRIPQVKGLEFRIDLGFYDAFFLGGAAGYIY
jgi:hypothetical protein